MKELTYRVLFVLAIIGIVGFGVLELSNTYDEIAIVQKVNHTTLNPAPISPKDESKDESKDEIIVVGFEPNQNSMLNTLYEEYDDKLDTLTTIEQQQYLKQFNDVSIIRTVELYDAEDTGDSIQMHLTETNADVNYFCNVSLTNYEEKFYQFKKDQIVKLTGTIVQMRVFLNLIVKLKDCNLERSE